MTNIEMWKSKRTALLLLCLSGTFTGNAHAQKITGPTHTFYSPLNLSVADSELHCAAHTTRNFSCSANWSFSKYA